jgi:hypothetical protein
MKKLLTYPVIFLLVIGLAIAVDVTRDMPDRIQPGSALTVTFNIANAQIDKLFTLEESLPSGLTITAWNVEGSKEPKDSIDTRMKENRYGWSFTVGDSTLKITYTINIPSELSGDYTFEAVWFDPSGFNRDTKTVTVAPVICGDGICEGDESPDSCPADCKVTPPPPSPPPTEPEEVVTPPEQPVRGLSIGFIVRILVVIAVIIIAIYIIYSKKKQR